MTMRTSESETLSPALTYQSFLNQFTLTCPLVQVKRPADLVGIGGHRTTLSGLSDLKSLRVALCLHCKFILAYQNANQTTKVSVRLKRSAVLVQILERPLFILVHQTRMRLPGRDRVPCVPILRIQPLSQSPTEGTGSKA